jgi:hypothetical protein
MVPGFLTLSVVCLVSGGAASAREAEVAAGPATQAAARKLNPDLLDLPPNTWVKIKPNRNPEGRSYSGICWGNGLIYYFGGYHFSYTCNDVELYDAGKDEWSEVKMAGPVPRGCYTWGLLVNDPDHKCNLLLNVLGVQGSPRWGGPVDGFYAFRLKKDEAQR